MREQERFSLIEIFGQLPVHPEVFSTLDKKLKYLGKADEGESWCMECGTLQPQVPRKHHISCGSYKDADEYEAWINPLGLCPECESEDGLHIDSSREMQCSAITCIDCCYSYSGNVDEETLTERFLKQMDGSNHATDNH